MAGRLSDPAIDTVEEVLAIRTKAKQLVSEGKTMMEGEEEGVRWQKTFGIPLDKILDETRIFLKQANPETYGHRITRTRAAFSGF